VLTGDKVLFDGLNSMSFKSNITSFKWEFHDGTSANGPMAHKVYDKPGCYIASLWVNNIHGDVDVARDAEGQDHCARVAGPVRNPSHPRARLPQQRISNGAGIPVELAEPA